MIFNLYENITFSHDLGKRSTGYATLRCGGTVILSTVNVSPLKDRRDFLPLQVNYVEKYYAVGKIPGNFARRELRSNDHETLLARLIDRALRPSIYKYTPYQISIKTTVLSYDDSIGNIETLSIMASSAALRHSGIDTYTAISSVSIGYDNDQFLVNNKNDHKLMHLVISGNNRAIFMVDGIADNVPVHIVKDAFAVASDHLKIGHKIIMSVTPKAQVDQKCDHHLINDNDLQEYIYKLYPTYSNSSITTDYVKSLKEKVTDQCAEQFPSQDLNTIKGHVDEYINDLLREHIVKNKVRFYKHGLQDNRPTNMELSYLPKAHGSCLMSRGNTCILSTVTLSGADSEQLIDYATVPTFNDPNIVHYNFDNFCVGEIGSNTIPKRREIGHGQIVKRSLLPVLPNYNYPYTIRVCCDTMSADGSTSLTSVCASSMALMDAGVPIVEHIGAVGIGLIEYDGEHVILSDIVQMEDALSSIDAKIAGSKHGFTMLMFDIKSSIGINLDVIYDILDQGVVTLKQVINSLYETIPSYRTSYHDTVSSCFDIQLEQSQIGVLIGKQGVTIKALSKKYKADIKIDSDTKVARVFATTADFKLLSKAINKLLYPYQSLSMNKKYEGQITKILSQGVIVKIDDGIEGYLPLSCIKSTPTLNDHTSVLIARIDGDRIRFKN